MSGKKYYAVERFTKKKGTRRNMEYFVKWSGFKRGSWVPASQLIEDLGGTAFKELVERMERMEK